MEINKEVLEHYIMYRSQFLREEGRFAMLNFHDPERKERYLESIGSKLNELELLMKNLDKLRSEAMRYAERLESPQKISVLDVMEELKK